MTDVQAKKKGGRGADVNYGNWSSVLHVFLLNQHRPVGLEV